MKKTFLLALAMTLTSVCAMAEGSGNGISLKVRAGYSLGASSPYGMPEAIVGIDVFRLTPSIRVGADASLPLESRWALSVGLFMENKAMDVDVRVKGYHMEMRQGTEGMEGVFTGHVSQQISMLMLTVPMCATYAVSSKVELHAGVYGSLLINKKFTGVASDGYIRRGGPTGPRIDIGNTPETQASYDFSNDMRKLQAGATVGVDWMPWSRLGFSFDLYIGFTSIFKASFKTVEQTLYPIYGSLGVFYRFL